MQEDRILGEKERWIWWGQESSCRVLKLFTRRERRDLNSQHELEYCLHVIHASCECLCSPLPHTLCHFFRTFPPLHNVTEHPSGLCLPLCAAAKPPYAHWSIAAAQLFSVRGQMWSKRKQIKGRKVVTRNELGQRKRERHRSWEGERNFGEVYWDKLKMIITLGCKFSWTDVLQSFLFNLFSPLV